MSPAERLAELSRILAVGLIRMKARQSSPLSADWFRRFIRLIWREE
jgi:hypothetical protein